MDTKVCNGCKKSKEINNFRCYERKSRKDDSKITKDYYHLCDECRLLYNKEHYRKNRDKRLLYIKDYKEKGGEEYLRYARDIKYKINYGIGLKEFEELLDSQNGVCAICSKSQPEGKRQKYLSIDHNHTTGEIRGLLCTNCNSAIGFLNESIKLLKNTIKYLTKKKRKIK